jgi:alpha-tubulin suppressor-like RCC1 family protein
MSNRRGDFRRMMVMLATRRLGWLVSLVMVAVVACFGGDHILDSGALPSPMLASDPVATPCSPVQTASLQSSVGSESNLSYLALSPGTVPGATTATILSPHSNQTITAAMIDGGMDPVPITATPGDTLRLEVRVPGNPTPVAFTRVVPESRRPVVVRTDPPPRKRDHPLNTAIVVVFSEPVNPSTLTTASVQLLHGTTAVAGSVHLLQGSATTAVFVPDEPLEPQTGYRLVTTTAVRDLQGDGLEASDPVEFSTGSEFVGAATQVFVLPDTTAVAVGSQVQLSGVPVVGDDSMAKIPVPGLPIVWSSENPAVAIVCQSGLVTAVAEGEARIRADVDQGLNGVATGFAVIRVSATLAPVQSVEIAPDTITLAVRGGIGVTAIAKDSTGAILPFRTVTWQTSDSARATVETKTGSKAWVTTLSVGAVEVIATIEGKSATAQLTIVTPGAYAELMAAGDGSVPFTCGITTDGWGLCWGENDVGQLGVGTPGSKLLPTPLGADLRFSRIRGNYRSTCGLSPDSTAYCWGDNGFGTLGIGATPVEECFGGPCASTPVAVAGGHRYITIGMGRARTGEGYACALTAAGDAYCWGRNAGGLGIGTSLGPETCGEEMFSCSKVPVAVVGGLKFTDITVGGHACGLADGGAAYCWGLNYWGELGDGTTTDRFAPTRVVGGLSFVALSAGGDHTCGLTSDGTAYCWGAGWSLGNGDTTDSASPVPVAGGLKWSMVSAGGGYTCGVTLTGIGYCWGLNYGTLGDGTRTWSSIPVAVAGGLTFTTITAGGTHTCGVTVSQIAYCWGNNQSGALGTGTTSQEESLVPVKVAGQP